MADVGLDPDEHAQTSGDMEKGGQSLTDSSQAISRLIDTWKAEYWSEGTGFQATRRSLIVYLWIEKDTVSDQKIRFQKSNDDADTATSAFEAVEQGNTDGLACTLTSMNPQPAGTPSFLATQAPSQITGGGLVSSGNVNGATASSSGGSGSGTGMSPTQSTPSEV